MTINSPTNGILSLEADSIRRLSPDSMRTSDDTLPGGLLILSHPELIGISPRDITGSLPDRYNGLPTRVIELNTEESLRAPGTARDWTAEQRALDEQFHAAVKPARDKFPDYSVVYFGSSSVPLTIYLGYLLETWQRVEVVPHHHERRAWGWTAERSKAPARVAPVILPDYKDRSPGEAIVRVSTSHRVDPYVTRQVVPEPVLLEVDISLETPGEDAFNNMDEMLAVAAELRRALDRIGADFPGVQRVHLFASVQPGMALLLGAQISKTMHPAVQTYQYLRNAEDALYHVPALLINGPRSPEAVELSDEQEARATRDREDLARDFDRMKGLARQEQRNQVSMWLAGLLPSPGGHPAFSGTWRALPPLSKTPLVQTRIDTSTRIVEDSFRLNAANEWQIDDGWLARLARRIPEEEARRRALRMLVLHETVHRGPQGLTRTLSQGIGRFPKVLEEMDYHADVWTMLYEHTLTDLQSPSEIDNPTRFFQKLIRVATETMWAFDDDGQPLRQIQVRRLNRYLIWYWQYLLLERAADRETGLADVLELLGQRPIIEIAGPTVMTLGERVFFGLDTPRIVTPELCVYHQGRLHRHGPRIDFPISALLEGFRERNAAAILDVLRAAVEQTAR